MHARFLSVLAPAALVAALLSAPPAQAQGVMVTFDPAGGTYDVGTQLTVTVRFCALYDHFNGGQQTQIHFNGADVTGTFDYQGGAMSTACLNEQGVEEFSRTGVVTIANAANTLWVAWQTNQGSGETETNYTPNSGVTVTPDGGTATRDANTSGHSQVFTVQNVGATANVFTIACATTGPVTCTGTSQSSVSLGPTASTTVTATYSVGAPGSGTLSLTAAGTGAVIDTGSYTITVAVPAYVVSVTPDGQPAVPRAAQTGGHAESFTITNAGTQSNTYTITCASTGPVTCTGTSQASVALSPLGGSANITANFSAGAVGSGTLTLRASSAGATDTGSYQVTVANPGPPAVTLRNHNSDNRDRSLCLTTGAGEAAGVSCGDLFVVHPMPVYRTLGRDRSLTLYYSSAAATGLHLLAANIVQPSSIATPTKIRVVLTVGTSADSAEYSPVTSYPYDQPEQVVLGRGLVPLATGLHPLTLTVRNIYPSGSIDTTLTASALVVNRSASEYGRGWSLLGVEQVLFDADSTRLVWLGGDGSIRTYTKPVPASSVFRGAPGVSPDSLVRFDTLCTPQCQRWYRRELKHGVSVTFDSTGRHRVTRNRVGARTTFEWGQIAGQTRLLWVEVPPNDVARRYTFAWNSSTARLEYLEDSYGRRLVAQMSGDVLIRLIQQTLFPSDNHDTTTFEYQGGLLTRRLAETSALAAGFVGTTYEYQNAARLTRIKIPSGQTGTDTALIALTPWDEQGLALGFLGQAGVVTDADTGLATRVDGPVSGTGDAADFWVNRFGAAVKVWELGVNATTRFWRDSAVTLPGLVTRVKYPHSLNPVNQNSRNVRMSWNGRGNLVEVRDSSYAEDSQATTTTSYAYLGANAPDSPTSVTDALGRHTDYAYTALGLTDSVIDPRGLRTKFFYRSTGPLTGVVDSVANRQVETWREAFGGNPEGETLLDQVNRFTYDTMGNAASWTSPVGVTTSYKNDQAGRTTEVWDPLGYHRTWGYDGFNRVTGHVQDVTQQNPPGVNPLAGCDPRQVICSSAVAPFAPTSEFLASLGTTFVYDDDGLVKATDPGGVERRFAHDARRNQTLEWDGYDTEASGTTRRKQYYSVAGLLDSTVSRTGLKVRYRYDGMGRRTALLVPSAKTPNQGAGYYDISDTTYSDSVSSGYDVRGNLLVGKNRWATITRSYYANGALRSQVTLFGAEKDSVLYRYDQTGARVRLIRTRAGVTDSIGYVYGTGTGNLDEIRAWWGSPLNALRTVSFTYDKLGRRRQVSYPNAYNMTVTLRYDAAGILRRVISRNKGLNPSHDRFHFDVKNDQVDPGGRILHQDIACLGWQTGTSGTPLGNPCAESSHQETSNAYNLHGMMMYQNTQANPPAPWHVDTMHYDRSGNMIYRRVNDVRTLFVMDNRPGIAPNSVLFKEYTNDVLSRQYSYTGELGRKSEVAGSYTVATYWYDGLGRTSGVARDGGSAFGPNTCRYDPDGQMAGPCEGGLGWLALDGASVGAGSRWVFVQGLGAADDPLMGLYRLGGTATEFFWVTDGTGRQFAMGIPDGSMPSSVIPYYADGGSHAGGIQSSYGFGAGRSNTADIPGISFFRNRIYDIRTGRFTQEDPIGIAGGLNLFQYAGNNPATFTDPFGICPICVVAAAAWALYEIGSAAYDVYNAARTVANPEASTAEKVLTVGLAAASVFGPGGGYTAGAKQISGILREGGELIGRAGTGRGVRVVAGDAGDARAMFDRLAKGASVEPHPKVQGGLLARLPDGGTVGFRPTSGSGPATIDVHVPGVRDVEKIKFVPER